MTELPFRQVHLDFHTSPHVRDVGVRFDPDEFAQAFVDARVNSVTVFAKCHHGHLYYDTDRPERHPGLSRDLNLLREQVDALHARKIRAPIYISVQCDEYAANAHPEWLARDADGKLVRDAGPFSTRWQILDMSSGYREYLAEQTAEVLEKFRPVDGIFFDMCWDQPSLSKPAVAKMLERGLDPAVEVDRLAYARQVSLDYMRRFSAMVRASNPHATVHFNSRPLRELRQEVDFYAQVEIESLPTGGWGYMYFPKNVRFARNFGKPYLGMTARFHKSWADFGGLKPKPALMYECCQMLMHGAQCSIGDQLHPRGALEPAAYQLIGDVYRHVERCEPLCAGATPVTEVGVLITGAKGAGKNTEGTEEGAVRMLSQLRHQFDLIDAEADFSKYELLVLPDDVPMDDAIVARLKDHVAKGKAVLASHLSGLSSDAETTPLSRELGIVPTGFSPFTATYFRAGHRVSANVPDTDHVMYERGIRVAPAPNAISLAVVVEPYFERSWRHFCSHAQTPPDKPTKFSAAVLNGRVAYVAYPIFGAFARHGSAVYRTLVGNIIDLLLPSPLLRAGGPSGLETSVMRQGDRTIVHLLYFSAERRATGLDLIEDVVPLHDVPVSLRADRKPSRVYLAPEGGDLPFEYRDGRVEMAVPRIDGHVMVVIE